MKAFVFFNSGDIQKVFITSQQVIQTNTLKSQAKILEKQFDIIFFVQGDDMLTKMVHRKFGLPHLI